MRHNHFGRIKNEAVDTEDMLHMLGDEIVIFKIENKNITLPVWLGMIQCSLVLIRWQNCLGEMKKQAESTLIIHFRREKLKERTTRKKCVLME